MEKRKAHILVVDDEPGHVISLKALLGKWGFVVTGAASGEEAVDKVRQSSFDLVLMDVCMGGMDGVAALKVIKAHSPAIPVIIMTAYSTVASAVEALKSGAHDYLLKPLDFDNLRDIMESALEHVLAHKGEANAAALTLDCQRAATVASANTPACGETPIIGESAPMQSMLELIRTAGPTEATVLITGKSGTGKELVARAVHQCSLRTAGPLVVVNCAALSEHLLESELFGHEKGSFTGADRRREGRFFQAQGGTIFLDEIGELPLSLQAKLLRVLQQREIQRVGSDKTFTVDVRIVAATNRDLREEASAGRFREDLYYRLNVLHIPVPALAQHREDIPLLVQHFLQTLARKHGKNVTSVSPQALAVLQCCPWPGNVRQLENALEQAIVLMSGPHLDVGDLPSAVREEAAGLADNEGSNDSTADGAPSLSRSPSLPQHLGTATLLDGTLEDVEREAILHTLKQVNDHKTEAAERLGISRKTLYAKLKRYGLQ